MASVAARVSRGTRVTTNILVRDMDVARPNPLDMKSGGGRGQVPLVWGRQLALDTTLVSSLHCDGSPQPGAGNGAVLDAWVQFGSSHFGSRFLAQVLVCDFSFAFS